MFYLRNSEHLPHINFLFRDQKNFILQKFLNEGYIQEESKVLWKARVHTS